MGFFKRVERRDESCEAEDVLLRRAISGEAVTRENVMEIPAVSACVKIISETIAKLPIKLYRDEGNEVKEIKDDIRVKLLNDDTGDLLSPIQMKKKFIEDYLLSGAGYIYIGRELNSVSGLYYVNYDDVSISYNADPIYKRADILIGGARYREHEIITIARRSRKGLTGEGIIDECQTLLSLILGSLIYERSLVNTGGNKKGFLKSENRLDEGVIGELKKAWKRFYANNEENIIVLNKGIDFKEASNTVVEMQLNESKAANKEALCNVFAVPPKIIFGGADDNDRQMLIDEAIIPIVKEFEDALNRNLLLEKEKGSLYFALDTKNLMTWDISKRFLAYKTALDSNFMQIDEVRYELDLPALDMNFIKLGLQDVLLDPKTGLIYTPNTDATAKLGELKGLKKEKTEE